MNYLLLASDSSEFDWWVYLVISLVAVIVVGVVFQLINRRFRVKHDFKLIGGGVLVLVALACIAAGVALIVIDADISTNICVAIIAVGLILYAITIIYNIKRIGSAGITAIIIQTIFCVGCLIAAIEYLRPSNISGKAREKAIVEKKRRKYLDRNGRE